MYQIKVIHPNEALDYMNREKSYIATQTKPKNKKLLMLCGEGVMVGWKVKWDYLKSESPRVANGKIFAIAEIIASKRINNKEVRKICEDNGIQSIYINFDGISVGVSLEDLTQKGFTWINAIKLTILPYHRFITKDLGLLQPKIGELQFADGELVNMVS